MTSDNERLRKALEPFAREADEWADSVSDGYRPGMTEPRSRWSNAKAVFSIGDLRRARKLIEEG